MKTFIDRDYNIQSILLVLFFLLMIVELSTSSDTIFFVLVYFLIAVNHLISSNRKFFSKSYKKSTLFKAYYFISMSFVICLISVIAFKDLQFKIDFWENLVAPVLSFGIFGTPFLAIVYYFICCNDFYKFEKHNQ